MKINRDIIHFSDLISEKANQFFERKVEAFSRLEYLLQVYFKTELHLFGSLACGLAVDNSDIDVAID
jgi:DNA polymerase sigma